MSTRLLLCTCLLALATACDDGSAPAPSDSEFRDAYICLSKDQPPPTFVTPKGYPHPDDPEGLHVQLAAEQVDALLVATAQWDVHHAERCAKICDAGGLRWDEETCIAQRDYTYGEVEFYETENGEPRYAVPVDTGKTEIGCVCSE